MWSPKKLGAFTKMFFGPFTGAHYSLRDDDRETLYKRPMTKSQWREGWGVTLMVSALLIFCFLSASHSVGLVLSRAVPPTTTWFVPAQWGFLLLTILFFVTVPRAEVASPVPPPPVNVWLMLVLPVVISFCYGLWLRPGESLVFKGAPADKLWHFLLVPLGEELLFRGWLYGVLNRRYCGQLVAETNPLPVAALFSSVAFALWHLQNWATYPAPLLAFQVGYTFLAGLWLALLRWKSGSVWPGVVGHISLNLAASLAPFP